MMPISHHEREWLGLLWKLCSMERGEKGKKGVAEGPFPLPYLHTQSLREYCAPASRNLARGGRGRQQAYLSSGLDRSRFEILLTLHFQI